MLGGAVYVVVESLDAGAEVAGLTKIAVIKVTASAAAASLQIVDEFAMTIFLQSLRCLVGLEDCLSCCFNSGRIA